MLIDGLMLEKKTVYDLVNA